MAAPSNQGRLRFRRHWRILVVAVAVLAGLLVLGGRVRVRPIVTAGSGLPPRESIENITNDIDLFDSTSVHRITVKIDPADRQRMEAAYGTDGEKVVVPVQVEIDGVSIPGAGIRFKGNSSLWGVGGADSGPDGELAGSGEGEIDWEAFDQAFTLCLADRGVTGFGPGPGQPGLEDDDSQESEVEDFGFGATLFDGSGLDFAAPYLLVFDFANPAQRYQGLRQVALRTDGGGTILAEPVTIAAYHAAGLPAPRSSMVGLTVGDGDERLYGVTEVLDQEFVDRHLAGADGALFKATAVQSQDFSYRGDDVTKYEGFNQTSGGKRFDKGPLVDFIRFVNESSDEDFRRNLPKYIDVDELATLLAVNNVLVNTDSLGTGPGGNYYLFYDATAKRFRALGWDFNFSLGGLDGFNAQANTDPLDFSWDDGGGEETEGLFVGDGPESETLSDDAFTYCGPGAPDGDEFAGGFGTNRLVERFLQDATFQARYQDAHDKASQQLFDSGLVADEVTRLAELVNEAQAKRKLAPQDRLDGQNKSLTTFVSSRTDYLRRESSD